jgi:hypothetical protein
LAQLAVHVALRAADQRLAGQGLRHTYKKLRAQWLTSLPRDKRSGIEYSKRELEARGSGPKWERP